VNIENGKTGALEESGKDPQEGSLFLSVLAMLLGIAVLGFFVNGWELHSFRASILDRLGGYIYWVRAQ
jgi:hypothetical protein